MIVCSVASDHVQSAHRGLSDLVAALAVLLFSHNASFRDVNENGGGPVVSLLKSPPWFWAATNNPTRDYCTSGWRDSRAPVGASACCHPREATPRTSIDSQPEWGHHANSPRQLERLPLGIQSGSAVPLLSSPPPAPSSTPKPNKASQQLLFS